MRARQHMAISWRRLRPGAMLGHMRLRRHRCTCYILSVLSLTLLASCSGAGEGESPDEATVDSLHADGPGLPKDDKVQDGLGADLAPEATPPPDTYAELNRRLGDTIVDSLDSGGPTDLEGDAPFLTDEFSPSLDSSLADQWTELLPSDVAVPDASVDLPPDEPDCVPAPGPDLCDGEDSDCDGLTDEDAGCDDGNPCNGLETCDPATGKCQGSPPPVCPAAPSECDQAGGNGTATPGKLIETISQGFFMYDEDGWGQADLLLQEIEGHWSTTPTPLAKLLTDLNREAKKIAVMLDVECFHTGFKWNSGDQGVDYWMPQGISGTATAYADGSFEGKKVALVSWYHKTEEDPNTNDNKGVRVSFVDTTSMNDLSYRHALLVAPFDNDGTADFKAIPVHAGGIAWYGDYLFVADTVKGIRVFDLTRIIQVKTGNKAWIGKVSDTDGYFGHNYKYVVPQVTRFRLCPESCCARFSFVSLDLSATPVSLVAGEYTKDSILGRLHRWPLDSVTGLPLVQDGLVHASQVLFPGVTKMQGVLSWDGDYFISSSAKKLSWLLSPGTLFVGTVGSKLKERRWAYPAQDLHYSKFSGNLWCQSEKADDRFVFAVKKGAIMAGCD